MLFLRVGYAKEQIYSIMKQDIEVKYMLAHERNDYILTKLNAKGCVNVRHLSQELAVSEVTIRRDLEEMEKQGLLIRIHGGAKKNQKTDILSKNDESRMLDRLQLHFEQKNRVCKQAAEFIKDGDCVFLDGGTSIFPMLSYLQTKKIKIVTHSTLIQEHFDSDVAELFAVGGKLIPEYKMAVGPIALETLQRFNFDFAFIGCAGIDLLRHKVYTAEMDTLAVKKQAMQLAQQSYLLIDSSKTKIKGFCSFTDFSRFDGILCDEGVLQEDEELPENFMIAKTE